MVIATLGLEEVAGGWEEGRAKLRWRGKRVTRKSPLPDKGSPRWYVTYPFRQSSNDRLTSDALPYAMRK